MKGRILSIAAVLAIGAVAGFFGARAYEQSQCAKRLEFAAAENVRASGILRSGADQWAGSLADAQGEAMLRSFVAGLAPLVLAERDTSVDIAGVSLLRLNGVQGVSILRADGKTLYASDAKLSVTDAGNEQTRWALAASDFAVRESVRPGVREMALPVNDSGRVLAVVWLAYDSAAIRERYRPEPLKAALGE